METIKRYIELFGEIEFENAMKTRTVSSLSSYAQIVNVNGGGILFCKPKIIRLIVGGKAFYNYCNGISAIDDCKNMEVLNIKYHEMPEYDNNENTYKIIDNYIHERNKYNPGNQTFFGVVFENEKYMDSVLKNSDMSHDKPSTFCRKILAKKYGLKYNYITHRFERD